MRANQEIYGKNFAKKTGFELLNLRNLDEKYDHTYRALFRPDRIESAAMVMKKIPQKKRMRLGAELPVTLYPAHANKTLLSHMDRATLGVLGEVAMELTMLAFGYDQLDSKYEENHGLGGVFVDRSTKPEVFITEAKCRSESVSAEKIMKSHLGETVIHGKVTRGRSKDGKPVKTAMCFLDEFIGDHPDNVYKFAHRTVMSGHSQSAFQKLDEDAYARCSGNPTLKSLTKEICDLLGDNLSKWRDFIPQNILTALSAAA